MENLQHLHAFVHMEVKTTLGNVNVRAKIKHPLTGQRRNHGSRNRKKSSIFQVSPMRGWIQFREGFYPVQCERNPFHPSTAVKISKNHPGCMRTLFQTKPQRLKT
mmetsp:Transcript_29501/g.62032  ORF Transcript_29501/g.62032 Transcript_29501/m.62032 type:complete len:105 (+) Transcript_29501:191-505(+)